MNKQELKKEIKELKEEVKELKEDNKKQSEKIKAVNNRKPMFNVTENKEDMKNE